MIQIILILFIIIINYLLINSIFNKEKFSYDSTNNDFIISLFLTGGLCEEAENCIKSIENVGLKNKLIVTTLDNTAFECINKLNVKVENKKTNLEKEANFGTKQFFKIVMHKFKIIRNHLLKYNIVIYSDSDIVFLKNITNDINDFKKSKYDIMIQDDSNNFNNSTNLCTGFIFFKSNKKNLNLINNIINNMKHSYNKLKNNNNGLADQKFFNKLLKKHKINVKLLDLKDYPNGARYFDNYNLKYKNYKPKIVHNNYIIGTKNKIERFKKYNLWFI